MPSIQVRPERDLRNRYTEIEGLLKEHDPVVITKNGRGSAVLINIEDFNAYEDYLFNQYIAAKLEEAEKEAAKPDVQWEDAHEMIARMRRKYNV